MQPKSCQLFPHIDPHSMLHKWLQKVGKNVRLVSDEVFPMKPGHEVHVCLIQQLERQISKLESDWRDISNGVLSADIDGDNELMKLGSETDKRTFTRQACTLRVCSCITSRGFTSSNRQVYETPRNWSSYLWWEFSKLAGILGAIQCFCPPMKAIVRHCRIGLSEACIEGLTNKACHWRTFRI